MKIQDIQGAEERQLLTALIVSRSVLGHISPSWPEEGEGLFRSEWANLVAGWCLRFYRKFGSAPKKAIRGSFHRWAEKNRDEELVRMVEKFIGGLSREYEVLRRAVNVPYTLDLAQRHFNQVRLERLQERVEGLLANGDVDKALTEVRELTELGFSGSAAIDLLDDKAALQEAFREATESLITYPGDLGKFFGPHLQRDAFVAFIAPEKRGKSFWLLDVAWRALLQRRRVAFFCVGDMSRAQILRRFAIRASRRPLRAGDLHFPVVIKPPLDGPGKSERGDPSPPVVKYKRLHFARPLRWQRAWRNFQRVKRSRVRSDESYFKLAVHPAGTITVREIEAQLRDWERSGWTPDVVVIDYADILRMEGHDEERHKINHTWKQLRALSQVFHCLVVTATQSNAASYQKGIIDRSNFSEDKRKLAHVTGMVGINQGPEEKSIGVYRLNWVILREGEFSERLCVRTAGVLALANPAVISAF